MFKFKRYKGGADSPSLPKSGFIKDKRGATAVEFAMILPLFLFLTFGIIEWSFYGYMRGQLDSRIQQAMRETMTDNTQYYKKDASNNIIETREEFFDRQLAKAIKGATFGEVKTVILKENFQSAAGMLRGRSTGSTAGEANEFVRVTVNSQYKFFTPMLGLLNNNIDQMKMVTTVFIVNEAF